MLFCSIFSQYQTNHCLQIKQFSPYCLNVLLGTTLPSNLSTVAWRYTTTEPSIPLHSRTDEHLRIIATLVQYCLCWLQHHRNTQHRKRFHHLAAPPCTDAIGSIYQDERHHRHVEFGLDRKTVIIQVGKQRVVVRVKHCAGHLLQAREDVTGAGRILY